MRVWFLTACLLFSTGVLFAEEQIPWGPENSKIQTSIKYTVIGRYRATFDQYEGTLTVDKNEHTLKTVSVKIQSSSLRSSSPSLDNFVHSPQILDTKKFPVITFQGEEITKEGERYQVKCHLDLHGVKKEFTSSFTQEIKEENVVLKGRFVVRRKDFGVFWHKFLDQGGVLVGEHITIDWEIKLPKDRI